VVRTRVLKQFAPPVLLFLIVIAFYWKLTLSGQYELMWSPDQAHQIVPWLHVAARQWNSGTFPLWDPHMWGGQPLLGQAQPGIAYPLNWLLFSIPLKNGFLSSDILHWYFVFIHYMAALFGFLLCRDLGRSVPASMTAGLIFSLTSYMAATGWPQMINGAVWAPLVFLFLLRAIDNRHPLGSAALSGMCLGLSWLSGHHQVPLFLSLAAASTWIFYAVRGRRMDRKIVRLVVLAFLICGLVGAFQILPAREYGQHAQRWVGAANSVGWNEKVPYSAHETFSMAPSSILGVVLPGLATVSEPFVGFTALTLALIGVAARWRDHRVRLFAFLGIAAFVYALGANTVFEGIVYSVVPMVEKARTPAAAISLFGFAVSVLACFGVDALGRRVAAGYVQRSSRTLAVIGLFLIAALFVFTIMKIGFDQRLALAGVSALLAAGLMAGVYRNALRFRHTALLCGLLVLLETSSVHIQSAGKTGDLMGFIHNMRSNRDVAAFLRKQSPPFRIAMIGDDIPGNWAAYHDVDAIGGHLASLSSNITTVPIHNRNVQLLWGARYLFAKEAETAQDREVFTGQSGRKVFARDESFPRSWVVHQVERVENRQKINEAVVADLPSFARRAMMTASPPALDACGGDESAVYERPAGDTVIVKTTLACKGMVVVSDTYFAGWIADVDGASAEIYEVNAAMRGVVVPAGKHLITMRYRPTSVYLGAFLTLIGIAAAFGIQRYENGAHSAKPARQTAAVTP
jgi:hypothetical protein